MTFLQRMLLITVFTLKPSIAVYLLQVMHHLERHVSDGAVVEITRERSKSKMLALTKDMKTGITIDAVKTYIDTVLLLSSLMFAFAASYLTSFTTADLADADARWTSWCSNSTIANFPHMVVWCRNFPDHGAFELWKDKPSADLAARIALTYSTLGASVLVGVISYLSYIYFDPARMPPEIYRRWWLLFQWPMHLAMALFIFGVIAFSYTNALVYRIVYIDYGVIHNSQIGRGVWVHVQNMQSVMLGFAIFALIFVLLMGIVYQRFKNKIETVIQEKIDLEVQDLPSQAKSV